MSDFLTTTNPEWARAWSALARIVGDYADCCPETGEVWQYMGTVEEGPPIRVGGRQLIVHEFRHRHRQPTARRILDIPSNGPPNRITLHIATSIEYAPANGDQAETLTWGNVKPYPPAMPTTDQRATWAEEQDTPGLNSVHPKPLREDYAGAFDGFSVTSDADGGL